MNYEEPLGSILSVIGTGISYGYSWFTDSELQTAQEMSKTELEGSAILEKQRLAEEKRKLEAKSGQNSLLSSMSIQKYATGGVIIGLVITGIILFKRK
jgi:hypothetical protein